MSTLAERLEELAKGQPRGFKARLARACGIAPPSVNGWFSGDTKTIDGKYLLRAARFLGVQPEWLQHGKGPKYAPPPPGLVDVIEDAHPAKIAPADGMLGAVTMLVEAYESATPITIAQVTPLFEMLFTGKDKGLLDSGTIAHRIAELLAPVANQSVTPVSSSPAVNKFWLKGREGQDDGASGAVPKPHGQSNSDRGTRRNAGKG